jgi:hypothetical protein
VRRANFRAILGGTGAILLLELLVMTSMSGGAAIAGRGVRGACFAAILCGGGAIGYAYLLTRVRKAVRVKVSGRLSGQRQGQRHRTPWPRHLIACLTSAVSSAGELLTHNCQWRSEECSARLEGHAFTRAGHLVVGFSLDNHETGELFRRGVMPKGKFNGRVRTRH